MSNGLLMPGSRVDDIRKGQRSGNGFSANEKYEEDKLEIQKKLKKKKQSKQKNIIN